MTALTLVVLPAPYLALAGRGRPPEAEPQVRHVGADRVPRP